MKLKSLSFLGLLAAAPMASQAAMVEMNETELSDVNGQASFDGGFEFDFEFKVFGYEVKKYVEGYTGGIDNTNTWYFEKKTKVISPAIPTPDPMDPEDTLQPRTFYKKSIEIGKDVDGVRYIKPTFKWGPYIPNMNMS